MVLGLGYRSGMDVGCNEEMLNPGLAGWRLAVQGVQKADEAFVVVNDNELNRRFSD